MSDQKRMGRPQKAPVEKLEHRVSVTLTPRAMASLRERADRLHIPVAWMARTIIFTALEEPNE
jgi:hypothetical protein